MSDDDRPKRRYNIPLAIARLREKYPQHFEKPTDQTPAEAEKPPPLQIEFGSERANSIRKTDKGIAAYKKLKSKISRLKSDLASLEQEINAHKGDPDKKFKRQMSRYARLQTEFAAAEHELKAWGNPSDAITPAPLFDILAEVPQENQ